MGPRVAPLRIRGGEETKGSACGTSADSRGKRENRSPRVMPLRIVARTGKKEEAERRKEGGERGTGEGEERYEGRREEGKKGEKGGKVRGEREKREERNEGRGKKGRNGRNEGKDRENRRTGRRRRCGQTRRKMTGKLTVRRAGRGGATRGRWQKSENFCHFFQKNREKSKLTLQCKELVGRKSVECFILLQLICLTT